jgi:hypothetical protein
MGTTTKTLISLSLLLSLCCVSAQRNAERIDTTTPMIFSNHNVNLNNVGLDDQDVQHPTDLGPKLQGANVCTKQEA